MKFIRHMLWWWFCFAVAILVIFWPAIVLKNPAAFLFNIGWIIFIIISAGGVVAYWDERDKIKGPGEEA